MVFRSSSTNDCRRFQQNYATNMNQLENVCRSIGVAGPCTVALTMKLNKNDVLQRVNGRYMASMEAIVNGVVSDVRVSSAIDTNKWYIAEELAIMGRSLQPTFCPGWFEDGLYWSKWSWWGLKSSWYDAGRRLREGRGRNRWKRTYFTETDTILPWVK